MARIRDIRPDFFLDLQLSEVSRHARLMFIKTWTCSDLRGVFPMSDFADCPETIAELIRINYVGRFMARGQEWGYVPNWLDWQRIRDQEIMSSGSRPHPPGWKDPVGWAGIVTKGLARGQSYRWRVLRLQVFERDGHACQYCGDRSSPLDCDHVVPVSAGGETELPNLVTACFRCNRSKGKKLVSEWRR